MSQQTAVDWLENRLFQVKGKFTFGDIMDAKQMEKNNTIEHLIGFQIYLNNKGLITNHDWDFEKLAKEYVKKNF